MAKLIELNGAKEAISAAEAAEEIKAEVDAKKKTQKLTEKKPHAIHFKVVAVSSEQPIGGSPTERGVILMTLDGDAYAGRVNMMYHDVMVGDTVWVELFDTLALTSRYPKFIAIGFNGQEELPKATKIMANKVWTRPTERGKKPPGKPAFGFIPRDISKAV